MFIEVESLKYLAPEGRHVYSIGDTQNLKAPAGRHVYHAWASSSGSNTYLGL